MSGVFNVGSAVNANTLNAFYNAGNGGFSLLDTTGTPNSIKLQLPAATLASSYTLKLPATVGAANNFLKISTVTGGVADLVWATPGGGGDVSGPGGAVTANAISRWNGTSGTSIKDSPVTIDDTGTLSGVSRRQRFR